MTYININASSNDGTSFLIPTLIHYKKNCDLIIWKIKFLCYTTHANTGNNL